MRKKDSKLKSNSVSGRVCTQAGSLKPVEDAVPVTDGNGASYGRRKVHFGSYGSDPAHVTPNGRFFLYGDVPEEVL